MRKTINPQPKLRERWLELEHARELEAISSVLDAHPKINELVLQDLVASSPSTRHDVGCGGMSVEQVLRATLVKQLNQFTYRELAFPFGRLSQLSDLLPIRHHGGDTVEVDTGRKHQGSEI